MILLEHDVYLPQCFYTQAQIFIMANKDKRIAAQEFLTQLEVIQVEKYWLYRYVTRTNVSFFDPSPNDQRTEHSCA